MLLVKILKYNKLTLKRANIPKNGNEKILEFLSKTFNKSNPSNSIILSRTNNPITLNKKDLIIIINKIYNLLFIKIIHISCWI